MLTETIAAISTGGNNSGINIIRISGEKSLEIIKKIFTNFGKLSHQKIIYGKIIDPIARKTVDEVLVSYFEGPASYTGEDICEINCHGGRKVTLEVLQIVLENGARLATPGEFSKRAYINGKMDLSKAEAIIDIINAKTSLQSRIAIEQLEGSIKNKITEIREKLINMMAEIEVSIDYPEYDYEQLAEENILKRLGAVKKEIQELLETYNNGKYIKEGINLAIIGSTNVGKSSLLNALLKEDKAIVTNVEGTTRDVIEETMTIGNLAVNISDTAGIRDTEDIVEAIGVKKSEELITKADAIIYLIDLTKGMQAKDREILAKIENTGKPFIVCLNKVDISREKAPHIINSLEGKECIEISSLTKEGLDLLQEKLQEMFNIKDIETTTDRVIVNERHKDLLQKAEMHCVNAIEAVTAGQTIDIIAIEIKEVLISLGEITGEDASSDIIDRIFKKFCLGK